MNGPAGPIIYPAYLDQKGAEFLFRFGRAKGAHNDIRDIIYAHPPWPATGPMGPMPHRGHAVRRDIFITLWPSDPFSQVSQKRRNFYYLSPRDRSSRERSNTFSLLSSVEQSLKDWTRRDDEEGGRFGKVGEIVSRLGFTVERIGDGFVAAVSMPPGARRGVGVRKGKKDRERERVKGDEEGRWCGALVATGAVQLPPRNEGRPL